MEMTEFDSRAAADNGAWLHLKHPATGAPLTTGGKPCRVLVRGMESKAAIDAMAKIVRNRKGTSGDIEAQHARNVEAARGLIMGFENMVRDGKPMTLEDAEWFLGLGVPVGNPDPDQRTFAEQINAFAVDRSNYLGNGSQA